MINQFNVWSTQLSFFVALNWLFALSGSAAFSSIYRWRRFMLVKPSILLLLMANVLFQWPLAIYSGFYEKWLPSPYALVALVHGAVLGGVAGSVLLFNNSARKVWSKLDAVLIPEDSQVRINVTGLLFALCIMSAFVYLSYVPFECTGLYALIFDPISQPLARELSMKLQVDVTPRYAMAFMQAGFVPIMTALVVVEIIRAGVREPIRVVALIVALIIAWILAFLPGAKGTLVSFGLVVAVTFLLVRRLTLHFVLTPIMIAAALAPAIAIATLSSFEIRNDAVRDIRSCAGRMNVSSRVTFDELALALNPPSAHLGGRQERDHFGGANPKAYYKYEGASDAGYFGYIRQQLDRVYDLLDDSVAIAFEIFESALTQTGSILYRAIVVPFEVGGWYVHHLQTVGPFGVAGISRIASLLGVVPVDVPNLIGKTYGPLYYGHAVSPTISATVGFIFSLYSYFGIWALPMIIVLTWILDAALLVLAALHRSLVLPILAALSVSAMKFAESDYTTVWVTHGFGVILLVGALSLFVGERLTSRSEVSTD